jgi:hypothetical protein
MRSATATATAGERVQDRPRWLGIALPSATAGSPGGLAAVGELQAEPEGVPGRRQVTRAAGPDPCGQEDFDTGGKRLTAR